MREEYEKQHCEEYAAWPGAHIVSASAAEAEAVAVAGAGVAPALTHKDSDSGQSGETRVT